MTKDFWAKLVQVTNVFAHGPTDATFAQQDPGRFAELYEQNFHKVYAYVAGRVQDRSQTQDLTAHVFQQALANIGKFKWRGAPFVTWLYRIRKVVLLRFAEENSFASKVLFA